MRKPSKKVVTLFAEVERIAAKLLELTAEEQRLRKLLEQIGRTRTVAMATLAARAAEAVKAEAAQHQPPVHAATASRRSR